MATGPPQAAGKKQKARTSASEQGDFTQKMDFTKKKIWFRVISPRKLVISGDLIEEHGGFNNDLRTHDAKKDV